MKFTEIEKLGDERLILIIGRNGSGKTVFLRKLLEKIILQEEIFFSDKMLCLFNDIKKPLNELFIKEMAEQTFVPLEWDKKQKEEYDSRFKELWDEFGFDDSLWHQQFSTLSEGEKQIILCIIFYLVNPLALVVDEPEQYLSKKSQNKILELFQDYIKQDDRRLIIATHDKDVINELSKIAKPKMFVFDDEKFIDVPFEEWKENGWKIAFGGEDARIDTKFKFL